MKNVDEFGIIGGMFKNVADILTPNIQAGIQNCTSSIRWGFFIPSASAIQEITELVEQGKVILSDLYNVKIILTYFRLFINIGSQAFV